MKIVKVESLYAYCDLSTYTQTFTTYFRKFNVPSTVLDDDYDFRMLSRASDHQTDS